MSPFGPILDSLRETWWQIQLFLPRLLGAIGFLILGWLVAKLARRIVIRVLRWIRLETAAERAGIEDFLLRGGVRFTTVTLIGQVVYWLLLLIVVLAAFSILGLAMSAALVEDVAGYLPNVLVALIIVVFGSLLARFVGGAVRTWLNNVGVQGALAISVLAQGAMLVFVGTLALEQLKIGGQVLVSAFQLAFGGLCLALALAFGLGGRDWAAGILDRSWKLK